MQRLNIQTHVWTINDPDTMDQLVSLGVEGLMTDDAKALKTVLMENNVWAEPLRLPPI
jgi:glycerophosphoryl diester phosphodiesterase